MSHQSADDANDELPLISNESCTRFTHISVPKVLVIEVYRADIHKRYVNIVSLILWLTRLPRWSAVKLVSASFKFNRRGIAQLCGPAVERRQETGLGEKNITWKTLWKYKAYGNLLSMETFNYLD